LVLHKALGLTTATNIIKHLPLQYMVITCIPRM